MNTRVHAPHAHAPVTVGRVMGTVMLALTPATGFAFWLHGWPAVNLWLVALASAAAGEALTGKLQGRSARETVGDGSGLLTAWLLALCLPPWAPWWIAAVGSLFAVIVAKQIFGGLGQNPFNPAMAARVMLLIAFPVEMTAWVTPLPLGSDQALGLLDGLAVTFGGGLPVDGVSGATVLGHVKTELGRGAALAQAVPEAYPFSAAAWGQQLGSLGETSVPFLLAGGLFLLARRVITWHAPMAMLAGVAVPALLMSTIAPASYPGPLFHLFSGGLMLGAFFIVTDPVTSPNTAAGQLLFGLGVGLLTWIIRSFGGYPEGVAFAVLLMNAATPVIDRYLRPRIYGRGRAGKPLVPKKEAAR